MITKLYISLSDIPFKRKERKWSIYREALFYVICYFMSKEVVNALILNGLLVIQSDAGNSC